MSRLKLADLDGHGLLLPEEGSAIPEMILQKVVDTKASPIMALPIGSIFLSTAPLVHRIPQDGNTANGAPEVSAEVVG